MILWYDIFIRALVSDVTNAQSHHGGCIMSEKLYPIKGYEGLYSITKSGKVWSHKLHGGKFLKERFSDRGYVSVVLYKNGVRNVYRLNRLMAITFIPNPLNKPEVAHIDNNRANNNLLNLEWNTHVENMGHAKKCERIHGKKGVDNHNSKLTEEDIKYIRNVYERKWNSENNSIGLSKKFNVSMSCICRIVNGVTYA